MVASPPGPALSPLRRAGYRLLGPSFDYLLHLRPAEWPIMAAHTTVGYLLAVGVGGALDGERLGPAVLGLVLWVLCLNGGTLAINSAFDQDEGDIGYLKAPPPPPGRLALFAFLLMAGGQIAATLWLPPGFAWAYAICFVLSLLYSVPPVRLKAVPGVDWLINMWGFGSLTPYAGYAATGQPLATDHALVLLAFCPLFAALYPLTQLYQFEEDQRRGDRTLALILGVRRSLLVALVATGIAFALFAAAGAQAGWSATADGWVRWSSLGLAFATWVAVLLPWLRRHHRMAPNEHQRGMYAALRAWAVTDIVVIFAWGLYT